MRAKDLVEGAPYATCDGQYIVPVGDTTKKWVWEEYREEEKAGVPGKLRQRIVPADHGDPWGPCHGARRRSPSGSSAPGVRCKEYLTDRDGTPQDDGHETIVRTVDIKGTWLEYLALHGETVRGIADAREFVALCKRAEKFIGDKLRPYGLRINWGLHILRRDDESLPRGYGTGGANQARVFKRSYADHVQYNNAISFVFEGVTWSTEISVSNPSSVLAAVGLKLTDLNQKVTA